ncbi:hypothetical protein [Tepidimonas sp.]|uniref:hypothetical protein n=1 Tax=Tepidimonas sp. TaxID=2002775 RepID=UPI003FCC342F
MQTATHWQALQKAVEDPTQSSADNASATAVAAALRLWERVAETSGLRMDPQPALHYLISATVLEAPEMLLALSQTRRLAAFQLRAPTAETGQRLADQAARLEAALARAQRQLTASTGIDLEGAAVVVHQRLVNRGVDAVLQRVVLRMDVPGGVFARTASLKTAWRV